MKTPCSIYNVTMHACMRAPLVNEVDTSSYIAIRLPLTKMSFEVRAAAVLIIMYTAKCEV